MDAEELVGANNKLDIGRSGPDELRRKLEGLEERIYKCFCNSTPLKRFVLGTLYAFTTGFSLTLLAYLQQSHVDGF